MREIKFRAWDGQKMVNIWKLRLNIVGGIECFIEGFDTYLVGAKPMQYTGLKDKNGVEIYEGDIVEQLGVVTWYDRLFWDGRGSPHPGFYLSGAADMGEKGELSYHDGFDDEIEIIGNIYENK